MLSGNEINEKDLLKEIAQATVRKEEPLIMASRYFYLAEYYIDEAMESLCSYPEGQPDQYGVVDQENHAALKECRSSRNGEKETEYAALKLFLPPQFTISIFPAMRITNHFFTESVNSLGDTHSTQELKRKCEKLIAESTKVTVELSEALLVKFSQHVQELIGRDYKGPKPEVTQQLLEKAFNATNSAIQQVNIARQVIAQQNSLS